MWNGSYSSNWTDAANWSDNTPPVAGEIADLSLVTGTNTIDLAVGVTVGEIFYNPAFSGATNTLTILSDTAEPSSKVITLVTTATNHLQVGEGAELRVEADLLSNANLVKDGHGTLVVGRRLYANSTAAQYEWWIEQGRVVNEGTIIAPRFRLRVGTVEPEAGVVPELVLREGSSYLTSSYAQNSDVIFGGNRLGAAGTGSRGVVTQEGGVLNLTTNLTGGAFLNGYAAGGNSVYNLSGGEVNLRGKTAYVGFYGTGTVNQTGGKLTATTLNFSASAAGRGFYNLEGGELWLGGAAQTSGGGSGAFNIGGASIYPFNTGFSIASTVNPRFTGTNGPARFRSEHGGFTNYFQSVAGTGGFVKEGADTLSFSGRSIFTGPIIISNGTVNVNGEMVGGNVATVAGGSLNLNVGASVNFTSLTVTGGVFQVSSNSVFALKGTDPWARVTGTGTARLLDGSTLLRLDVSGSGVIDLGAGCTATVYRVRIGGVELVPGYYNAANCAAITGPGLLHVSFQNARRAIADTFSRADGPLAGDSLGRTEEPGGTDWSEFRPFDAVNNAAAITNGELRLGLGTSDPMIALTAASWPNGLFTTRMRFGRVGAAGATVKNGCGLLLRRNITLRTGSPSPDWSGAVHVLMTAAGGLFLRENYDSNKYYKNPFTGGDYLAYGAAGSLPASINGLPFDADGDGRLGDDEPFDLQAVLYGSRMQVLINGEPVMANNGFASTSASEENCAGFWVNRLSSGNVETHDSYHDDFAVTNLPFLIRHIDRFDPNIAAAMPRENWTLSGNTTLVPVGPVTETVGGETVHAWSINDASSAGGSTAQYNTTLLGSEIADVNTNRWRLTMRLRVVNANDAVDDSVSAQVATTNRAFTLRVGSDASGNARVSLNNGTTFTVAGGSVYHTYMLDYNPSTASVDLFCDGALLQSGVTSGTYTLNRIFFGSNASATTGYAHYQLVQFSILWPEPPPSPEPPPPPPPPGTLIQVR
jgi:autotransporter-associated beta strand protein